MMNITITLNDNTLNVLKELTQALTQALKEANILKDKNTQVGMLQQPVQQPTQLTPAPQAAVPIQQPIAQPQSTAPISQPTQPMPVTSTPIAQPIQQPQAIPTAPVQQPVPTQAVTYDIQKLAIAAMQLKDAGRLNEIQELIAKYNIASIMQLKPEQFESFAQDLIAKGVKF